MNPPLPRAARKQGRHRDRLTARSRRPAPRKIVLVTFPGAQILDVTGPSAVFTTANRCSGEEHYVVEIVSSSGKSIPTSGAVRIGTRPLGSVPIGDIDTLLIAGGDDRALVSAMKDRRLRDWVLRAAPKARRYGSVCSGAFLLASYGLIDGRRVATHWDGCALLSERFPAVTVDADALYVVDGPVWTSAGVTTGIDMALAMVEQDLGASLSGAVAERLVVYARRPGHQSQFSALLKAQNKSDAPYDDLVAWM